MRLFQIEGEIKGRRVVGDPFLYGEVRERVGQIVGMSGRNLARYLNVLSAPIEVQDAFEPKQVKLVDAAKVVTLAKKQQEELAARLWAGEDARSVFATFFPPNDGKHVKTADAVACLARSLNRAGADFTDRLDKVKPGPVRANADALRAARN